MLLVADVFWWRRADQAIDMPQKYRTGWILLRYQAVLIPVSRYIWLTVQERLWILSIMDMFPCVETFKLIKSIIETFRKIELDFVDFTVNSIEDLVKCTDFISHSLYVFSYIFHRIPFGSCIVTEIDCQTGIQTTFTNDNSYKRTIWTL